MRITNIVPSCLFACSACFGAQKPISEIEQKTHQVSIEKVCYAALDIGSSSTKLCVALVEKDTGRADEILHEEEFPILLGHHLEERKDGILGDNILQDVENQVRRYRDLALKLGAKKVFGVATAVFRNSTNGETVIHKISKDLGVDLRVISQQEEGYIGFLTAVSASKKESKDVICWDFGGASFQISTIVGEKLVVYEGPWGSSKALAEMVSSIQRRPFTSASSANPAKIKHVNELCENVKKTLPPITEELLKKLKELNGNVISLRSGANAFDIASMALENKKTFSKEELWSVIQKLVDKTDEELSHFPKKETVIPRLALIYTIMDYFGINTVQNCHAIGSTLGIFINQVEH